MEKQESLSQQLTTACLRVARGFEATQELERQELEQSRVEVLLLRAQLAEALDAHKLVAARAAAAEASCGEGAAALGRELVAPDEGDAAITGHPALVHTGNPYGLRSRAIENDRTALVQVALRFEFADAVVEGYRLGHCRPDIAEAANAEAAAAVRRP
jgi:hypothetical protein